MDAIQHEWHLDRKVIIGLAIAILANAGSSIWWAASINSQVANQQKQIDAQMVQISAVNAAQSGVGERLAKVESGITYQTKVLDQIAADIRRK